MTNTRLPNPVFTGYLSVDRSLLANKTFERRAIPEKSICFDGRGLEGDRLWA